MARQEKIARSIVIALVTPDEERADKSISYRISRYLKAFFVCYSIGLHQHAASLFAQLRKKWSINQSDYVSSFHSSDDDENKTALEVKGPMGYSGSTFFTTRDGKYLVKSVPRHFENSFFKDDLLQYYINYSGLNLDSLLIRITDFLAVDNAYKMSPGITLGFTPSHYIVMENLLVGRDEGEERAKEKYHERTWQPRRTSSSSTVEDEDDNTPWKWGTWDLKPTTYFFPERDIAQGKLTSDATKSRLADEFNDKLTLTKSDADKFTRQLEKDTELLQRSNAVDYSLFLIRIPIPPTEQVSQLDSDHAETQVDPFSDEVAELSTFGENSTTQGPDLASTAPTPSKPPFTPPGAPSWRTGIRSADGRHVYRATILDFFWAKHKAQAKIMTGLVNLWNTIDPSGDKGPMSITTTSSEYRDRFMKMCQGYIEVLEQDSEEVSNT